MSAPSVVITRRMLGEYSTAKMPDGSIQTKWTPYLLSDEPIDPEQVISVTPPLDINEIAKQHISEWENR